MGEARTRTFWVKLFARGQPPSDAVAVPVCDFPELTVSELKDILLEKLKPILPGETYAPWITLKLPPLPEAADGKATKKAQSDSEDDTAEDVYQVVEAAEKIGDLPPTAGSSKQPLLAFIRFMDELQKSSAASGGSREDTDSDTGLRRRINASARSRDATERNEDATPQATSSAPTHTHPSPKPFQLTWDYVIRLTSCAVILYAFASVMVFILRSLPPV
ncbi:hypothetical protein CBR_g12750 [Chara braunii]|uniref:Transmembrane protein n=1 Tax=Chara braunii TaxID=69332 RepID=A0A388KSJ0_CHABU|nr:hypothetical protein CBR_g12750 [Chara braunii]|eukprot:GBG73031.1 hypothetical protein CBR_g12750 [Chara braunii]